MGKNADEKRAHVDALVKGAASLRDAAAVVLWYLGEQVAEDELLGFELTWNERGLLVGLKVREHAPEETPGGFVVPLPDPDDLPSLPYLGRSKLDMPEG